MRLLSLLLLLFICGGCSLPRTRLIPVDAYTKDHHPQLLRLRFERWGQLLFSGLIGIDRGDDYLRYILLDGSGITLARARVDQDGNSSDLKAGTMIRESGLPAFLSETLQRIYLVQPTTLPCSSTFFFKLCLEQKTKNRQKILSAGPFTVFKIVYTQTCPTTDQPSIIFSQPWLGIRLTLRAGPNDSRKRGMP